MGSQPLATRNSSRKIGEAPAPASLLERRPSKPARVSAPPDVSGLSPSLAQIPVSPPSAPDTSPTRPLLFPLQRKLTIGAVNDPLEHEADRIADHVMRMPDPAPVEAGPSTVHKLQRKCSCAGSSPGECEECKRKDEGTLQRSARHVAPQLHEAPPIVHKVLKSSGQPLSTSSRAFFEPRFSHDFSNVRVHTEADAAASALKVNALAYTVGSNIVFAPQKYSPNSIQGQRLLAHELSHVVQQGNAESLTPGPSVPIHTSPLRLSRSPDNQIAHEGQEGLDDSLYPRQAGCVAQQFCGPSGGVPDHIPISNSCAQRTGYQGPPVKPSDEECAQYSTRTVLSEARLKVLSILLVEFNARQAAKTLTDREVTRIRDAVDYSAIPALTRAGLGKQQIDKALSVQPDPRIVAALADSSKAPLVAYAFSDLAEGGEIVLTFSTGEEIAIGVGASTEVVAAGTGAAEGASAVAGTATAAAAEFVPPLLLAAAVVLLLLYVASLPEPRADRLAPKLLEKAIQKIQAVLQLARLRDIEIAKKGQLQPQLQTQKKAKAKTKSSPAPQPEPVPVPLPEKDKNKVCPFPTGLTEADPIPIVWYKTRTDDNYPRSITVQGVSYERDDPDNPRTLPHGEPIGVKEDYWPRLGKTMRLKQLLPDDRGQNASRFRAVLRGYGFSWAGLDADHVQDLQWEGPDEFDNLWPMSNSANKSAGPLQNDLQRVTFCVTKQGPPRINITLRQVKAEGHFYRWFAIARS